MHRHSPLFIEIALHYHCSPSEFPHMEASACQDAVGRMLEAGLLAPSAGVRRYEPTDGLRTYVDALCAVPWPVMQWVMPPSSSSTSTGN